MKRTLSIGSRVPPAVTSTCTPASGPARAAPRAVRRLAASAASQAREQQLRGLGQAPDAVLARARPAARRRARRSSRRARAASRRFCLGGRVLVHARVHRRRDHQRAARPRARSCVSRLSARPAASLAIVLADAGAIRNSVGVGDQLEVADRLVARAAAGPGNAPRAGSRCELADEHRRPAERGEGRLADEAAAGRASARRARAWPAPVARRTNSSALYAAIPPLTPSSIRDMA